jgi:hypothetical protein
MERYGYCHLSAIPVRGAATELSEMVNQLLFGEMFEILETSDDFLMIRGMLDKYEGFIHRKQYLPLTKQAYDRLASMPAQFPVAAISMLTDKSIGHSFPILAGSNLRGFAEGKLQLPGVYFTYDDPIQQPALPLSRQSLRQLPCSFSVHRISGEAGRCLELTARVLFRWCSTFTGSVFSAMPLTSRRQVFW